MNIKYTVLVVDDTDISKYDSTKKVDEYIVYKYTDRVQLQKTTIKEYKDHANACFATKMPNAYFIGDFFKTCAENYEDMTPEEFFQEFTQEKYTYNEYGDAVSTANPDGKYSMIFEPTPDTAVPLFKGELATPFCGMRSDVIENPSNTDINSALFYNAFVSEETGWVEQADEDQEKWVLTFYDRFIKPLSDTARLKIYNFVK